jgi:hypothetical protein
VTEYRSVLERAGSNAPPLDLQLERILRRRDHRRRNQRITAGFVGLAVFVATVWIVTTGGPFDRTQTPAASGPVGRTQTPAPTGPVVPEEPDPIGLIGLPPEGTEPSTPRAGELVVNFRFGHAFADAGRYHLNVYADGRAIWWCYCDRSGEGIETGILERRLTPEGVELVRSEILSTGLFDHDLFLRSAHGLFYGGVEVFDADGSVQVSWGNDSTGGAPEGVAVAGPTPEQASALRQLDAQLEDLASWLPASAWVDEEAKPYVPSTYQICYGTEQGLERDAVLDLLPRPAVDLLRARDRIADLFPPVKYWCSTITTEEARAFAEIFEHAGFTKNHGAEVIYEDDLQVARIYFWPMCPDGNLCE